MADTPAPMPQLALRREGPLAWIMADNSQRMNAFTAGMWQALPRLVQEAEADPAVRVIILRGSGTRAFSAGADISEFESARSTQDAVLAYDRLNDEAFHALTTAAKPTIAMIHGFCLGGGFGIAACCDLRIGDTKSQFAIPAVKLGLGYNGRWIRPLLALAGPPVIKELLFTGRRFTSEEAFCMGLVNRLYEVEELEEATRSLALEIAANAPLSVKAAKLAIDEMWRHPEGADWAALDNAVRNCFESEDYAEGRRAFLEKRKPAFSGR
ncbi:MAG: enoyl-CoA hydratase [Hyphomicrobium sp.]|jgi:enoyl-CoA hydratase/carnithine racemase